MGLNKCLVCGHKWKSKKRLNNSKPIRCPACNSYVWDLGKNVLCFCCKKTILNPILHHKNRNRLDNSKENRVVLCAYCHGAIHHNNQIPKTRRKTNIRRENMRNKNKNISNNINNLKREF